MAISTKQLSSRRVRQIVAQTRRAEATIGRRYRNELRRFFTGQAKRVVKIWLDAGGYLTSTSDGEYKDAASQIIGATENDAIIAATRRYALEITVVSLNQAEELSVAVTGTALGGQILANDPMALYLAAQSAQRVVLVNDATRRAIARTIAKGMSEGFSAYEIARGSTRTKLLKYRPLDKIVGPPYLYRNRPDCIARTELAFSNNGAALHRYDAAGMAMVEVSDGPDCGWEYHDDPDKANRTLRTLKASNQFQIAHPNCVRVFMPSHMRTRRRREGPAAPIETFVTR